ncbi:Cell division protein FtsH [Minicystis rosea]|nr:Cell division protein FtsH [Minicystis rosea]
MLPYASSLEHVLAELARVDLLVRAHVARARRAHGGGLPGFVISEEEVDALLARPLGEPIWAEAPAAPELPAIEDGLEEVESAITARIRASTLSGVTLRLEALSRLFRLGRFDVDVLLIGLLPEVETRIERLYAYLQDDVSRRRPSIDLCLSLLCSSFEAKFAARERFAPEAPLRAHGLIHLFTDAREPHAPLLSHAFKVDERITSHLLGSDAPDMRLRPFLRLVQPKMQLGDLVLPDDLKDRLARFADRRSEPRIVALEGPPGVGKRALVEALCEMLEMPLCVVTGLSSADEVTIQALAPLFGREALLSGGALYWEDAGQLFDEDRPVARAALIEAIEAHQGLTFLGAAGPWEPPSALHRRAFLRAEIARPGPVEQGILWAAALAGEQALAADIDIDMLASSYRLTGGQIRDAAAAARSLSCSRSEPVTAQDLVTAVGQQSSRRLGALSRVVSTPARWDDLVLANDQKQRLEEILFHVRHRRKVLGEWGFGNRLALGKGLGALFSGPPGTGKTMAAGVLAKELGLRLHQIDLSAIVSKYIGETEKQLARLFDEAEAVSAMLFFDEADAVFGKRTEVKDAHDRNANLGTSYLLQRIEAYEGVVILASNFAKNMDDAFVRRLRFVVDFPMPGEDERRRIWERVFPNEVPRAEDVDLGFLAKRLEVAGGVIRNIALGAAFLAASEGATAVRMSHLLQAARREYQKMGKVVDARWLAHPVLG